MLDELSLFQCTIFAFLVLSGHKGGGGGGITTSKSLGLRARTGLADLSVRCIWGDEESRKTDEDKYRNNKLIVCLSITEKLTSALSQHGTQKLPHKITREFALDLDLQFWGSNYETIYFVLTSVQFFSLNPAN
jgi:hypothetical protein